MQLALPPPRLFSIHPLITTIKRRARTRRACVPADTSTMTSMIIIIVIGTLVLTTFIILVVMLVQRRSSGNRHRRAVELQIRNDLFRAPDNEHDEPENRRHHRHHHRRRDQAGQSQDHGPQRNVRVVMWTEHTYQQSLIAKPHTGRYQLYAMTNRISAGMLFTMCGPGCNW